MAYHVRDKQHIDRFDAYGPAIPPHLFSYNSSNTVSMLAYLRGDLNLTQTDCRTGAFVS